MPAAKTDRVILRLNTGSHAEVVEVYAYDPFNEVALVKLRWHDNAVTLDRVDETDLEAFYDDGPRTLAPVPDYLTLRAKYIIRRPC